MGLRNKDKLSSFRGHIRHNLVLTWKTCTERREPCWSKNSSSCDILDQRKLHWVPPTSLKAPPTDRPTIHELANMAAQRLRSQDEDGPEPLQGIQAKEQPSKKEVKEIEEMRKFQYPKLASKKVELKFTRYVLRCTNSRCKANFWNRDVNAARNILELLSARLLGFERIPAFAR